MTAKAPPCHHCFYYWGNGACDAFPAGIPWNILVGEVDHRAPIDGDGGIQFLAALGFEADADDYFRTWVFEPTEPSSGDVI